MSIKSCGPQCRANEHSHTSSCKDASSAGHPQNQSPQCTGIHSPTLCLIVLSADSPSGGGSSSLVKKDTLFLAGGVKSPINRSCGHCAIWAEFKFHENFTETSLWFYALVSVSSLCFGTCFCTFRLKVNILLDLNNTLMMYLEPSSRACFCGSGPFSFLS